MNKRDIVVYISGKYSGDTEANIQAARKKAIELWELGYTALTPHLNTMNFDGDCECSYQDYIEGDLVLLDRCDIIYMLEGWEESGGARIEKDYARKEGIYIVFNNKELNDYWKEMI